MKRLRLVNIGRQAGRAEWQMTKGTRRSKRIALFGHFDGTNLGNEATLQATLYHLQRLYPDSEVTCICTGPQTTALTYGVGAFPIARTYMKFWAPRNPLSKLARKICVIIGEPFRWLEGVAKLWGVDIFIVPGTGLVNDAYGLMGWGPYSLFRWAVIAKICRCRLAFVSIGAGPFYSTIGKFCVRSFLSLADFRSYRDETSRLCLQRIGFSTDQDRIFPDLAFSLPKGAISPREGGAMGVGAVVGLGVMTWADRYSKHGPDDGAQSNYLQSFAKLARWLLVRGYNVRLLIGDFMDVSSKQALLQAIGPHDKDRVIDEPICSVGDLMSQLAATDAVVATRFHNALLALLCEKPVIAVSFHHKCDELMNAMGLSNYCLDSGDLESEALIEKFRRLEANTDSLKAAIRERNKRFRDALDEQYRLVFDGMNSRPLAPSGAVFGTSRG